MGSKFENDEAEDIADEKAMHEAHVQLDRELEEEDRKFDDMGGQFNQLEEEDHPPTPYITNVEPEPFTTNWIDEVFDLLQEGLVAARQAALRAVGDPNEWVPATSAMAMYGQSVDRVGQSIAHHAMEVETKSSPFLSALVELLNSQNN